MTETYLPQYELPAQNRRVLLVRRPDGIPLKEDFEISEAARPVVQNGEVLTRNLYLSADPVQRGWAANADVTPLGKTMRALGVGIVIDSKLERVKEGDVVFVSGAAGAVGSAVVQIAKIKGCTVIGSAGGEEKCALVKSLGADECVDYRAAGNYEGLLAALRAAAPKGIDVYFDNVGGDHFQAAIECARPFARMAICGMISQYNDTEPRPGPNNVIQIVGKQLQIRGFIVSTHADMLPDFQRDMVTWIKGGQMKFEETVMEGIENAPNAFMGLFSGKNTGKMLVKLS